MTLHKKLFITGLIAICAGLFGVMPTMYFRYTAAAASPNSPISTMVEKEVLIPTTISGKPVKLKIPDLSMERAIVDGAYDAASQTWSVSNNAANFAMPTMTANNQTGNTLIYGHNRPEVFSRLKQLKQDDIAYLETDNGYRFAYRYVSNVTVSPTDTSIFAYVGDPQLTLQTCSGIWSQNRTLYTFEFVSYEKL